MRWTAVLVLGVVLMLGLAWILQRRLIYLPDRARPPSAATVLPGARDVVLRTDDGLELGAWYVPANGLDRDAAVLMAPGNAGNRAIRAPLAARLSAESLAVLLVDYRGYGGNPGSPSEDGLAHDVRAAHRYLAQQAGVPPHRQLYFGESLGAAVATELATEHPPGGLLLRSPFTDLVSVARMPTRYRSPSCCSATAIRSPSRSARRPCRRLWCTARPTQWCLQSRAWRLLRRPLGCFARCGWTVPTTTTWCCSKGTR